jgi:hypothetical protein
MNLENSAFFSLSFGTVSRIVSIHAAQVLVFPQSLKRIHYPLKTAIFQKLTAEGLGTSTWFKKKFMHCMVLKKKAL